MADPVRESADPIRLLRSAMGDPGQFTARGDGESVPAWGARAAMHALIAAGYTLAAPGEVVVRLPDWCPLTVPQLLEAWVARCEQLDRIARWHSQGTGPAGMVSGECSECGSPWPCDTRRLIDYGTLDVDDSATSPAEPTEHPAGEQ